MRKKEVKLRKKEVKLRKKEMKGRRRRERETRKIGADKLMIAGWLGQFQMAE